METRCDMFAYQMSFESLVCRISRTLHLLICCSPPRDILVMIVYNNILQTPNRSNIKSIVLCAKCRNWARCGIFINDLLRCLTSCHTLLYISKGSIKCCKSALNKGRAP